MIEYIFHTFLTPYSKKKFLSKKQYILFKDYYNQSIALTYFSLTYGYLCSENAEYFKLLGTPEKKITNEVIDNLVKMGGFVEKDITNDIKNVYDLFHKRNLKKLITNIYKNLEYDNELDLILKIGNNKVPFDFVTTTSNMLFYSYIGFGYKYPNLTKKLLIGEKINDEIFKIALSSGLNIPSDKNELEWKIEDHKRFVKEIIKPYINEYQTSLKYILNN